MRGLIDASRKGAYAVYSLPGDRGGLARPAPRSSSTALAVSDVERAAVLAQEHMLDVARRYSTASEADEDGA